MCAYSGKGHFKGGERERERELPIWSRAQRDAAKEDDESMVTSWLPTLDAIDISKINCPFGTSDLPQDDYMLFVRSPPLLSPPLSIRRPPGAPGEHNQSLLNLYRSRCKVPRAPYNDTHGHCQDVIRCGTEIDRTPLLETYKWAFNCSSSSTFHFQFQSQAIEGALCNFATLD